MFIGTENLEIPKSPVLRLLAIAALFLSASTFPSKALAAAPTIYTEAVQAYNSHQYNVALTKFQQAAKVMPSDPAPQYYMGLCCQATNQMTLAKEHYQWVAYYSRDAAYKSRAQAALQQLSKYQSSYSPPTQTVIAHSPNNQVNGALAATGGSHLSGKLKIYEFYTDWCHVCQGFAPIWDQVSSQNASKVEFIKLNAEGDGAAMAQKYGVNAYPTIIWTDNSGKIYDRIAGCYKNSGDFQGAINVFLARH